MTALFVIAQHSFQDQEFAIPLQALREFGVQCQVASLERGFATGKFGAQVAVDLSLSEAVGLDFDAVVFVGGSGAIAFQENEKVWQIAQRNFQNGKIVAAICIAPTILAKAGVLQGKSATVWNGDGQQNAFIENHGAKFVDKTMVVDQNVITANGPEAAEIFAQEILKKLQ